MKLSRNFTNVLNWILDNLGENVPLHFTAFHPDFKMKDKESTPEYTLLKARGIALSLGIKHCYVGNIHNRDGQTTYCPGCGDSLIKRDWHTIISDSLINGSCSNCNTNIQGVFK